MSATPEHQPRVIAFAGFRFDPARRSLTGPDGESVALQPRIFDLLALFLARPGELLGKQTIMDAVWPDTIVDENNLNQAVSTLRKALGEPRGEPRFIATVPRRGYQLIVPVEPLAAGADPPPTPHPVAAQRALAAPPATADVWPLAAAAASILAIAAVGALGARDWSPAPTDASIAVLPFKDMSPAQDQGYFADGVAEEIQTALSGLEGLRVAGLASSAAAVRDDEDPRAIGRTLGVAHVLEGGVRQDGGRLRVSARLVSTTDGYQIWSESYDRPLDDVFAVQDEIAASVSQALSVTLGVAPDAARPAPDVAAYDHYLRGRAYWAQSGAQALNAAIGEFREAVEIDPGFAPAWASMARAADFMTINEPARAPEFRALQAEATARALEAAPEDWESVALSARLLMREWRWTEAADALAEAERLGPPPPVAAAEIQGAFLMQTGRAREALPVFEAAAASDPLSFSIAGSVAWALDLTGDPHGALAQYARAEALPGDETDWAFQQLLRLLEVGDDEGVQEHLKRYPYQEDGASRLLQRLAAIWRQPRVALALLARAKDDPAIEGPHRIDALAVLAAYYGDADLAVELLREEFFVRGGGATVHLWHPLMSEVRRTEGFEQLVRDLGFVDYWQATGHWPDACRPVGRDDFACS